MSQSHHDHYSQVSIKDLEDRLKECYELLEERRRRGLVRSAKDDWLSKSYESQLKIIVKRVKAFAEADQQLQSSRTVIWSVIYLFLPTIRPTFTDITVSVRHTYLQMYRLKMDFIKSTDQRGLIFNATAFAPDPRLFVSSTLPTANAVNEFAKRCDFRAIQRPQGNSEQFINSEKPLTVALDWWNVAYNIKPKSDSALDQFVKASQIVIFLRDRVSLFTTPLDDLLEIFQEMENLIILLMRFASMPEGSESIRVFLNDTISVLHDIYELKNLMHENERKRKAKKYRIFHSDYEEKHPDLYSIYRVPSPDIKEIYDDQILNIKSKISELRTAVNDRRAMHWSLLQRQDSRVFSVGLPSSASSSFTGERLFRLLAHASTIHGSTIVEVANEQNRGESEHKSDDDNALTADSLVRELRDIGLLHVEVEQEGLLDRSLGGGRFTRVYKTRRVGMTSDIPSEVVVKIFDKGRERGKQSTLKDILREATVWNEIYLESKSFLLLNNRHLVAPLLGFSYIQSASYPGLVSPYYFNGDLMHYIGRNNPSLTTRLGLLLDVARGLQFIHSILYVHRDLRAANILVDNTCHAVIGDFGTVTRLRSENNDQQTLVERLTPELQISSGRNKQRIMCQTDIHAFGTVCVEVIIGRTPTQDEYKSVHNAERNGEEPLPIGNMMRSMWEIVTECWRLDPYKRPTAQEVALAIDRLIHVILTS